MLLPPEGRVLPPYLRDMNEGEGNRLFHGNFPNDRLRNMRTVRVTRYVTPLREGGSLPGLVEADDDGLYVLKFRGAGQGTLALVAEVIAGECARALGFPVPELVFVDLDTRLAGAEPDPDIQNLIKSSAGINLGVDFLPGSLPFAPPVSRQFAADVVWFDALVTNVDRTPKNPNLLTWQNRIWLIDHGAAFMAQHREESLSDAARMAFPLIRDHVLLPFAGSVRESHDRLSSILDAGTLEEIAAMVPPDWFEGHDAVAYREFIMQRLRSGAFAEEADRVRK